MSEKKLDQLLAAAKQRKMSPQEEEAQRVSFAFGNAPDGDSGTIETMKAAATILDQSKPS
jgi:hypothetical protein